MQQRRVRLGDILDDYCPRERRVTNHVVAAMIEDEVKQTRCTTCEADHEYRHAKVPVPRRKKPTGVGDRLEAAGSHPSVAAAAASEALAQEDAADVLEGSAATEAGSETDASLDAAGEDLDEGPVHRPLIRATLPRPEGQVPERKAPDFTLRQPGTRFDGRRNGTGRPHKGRHGTGQSFGPSSRFGDSQPGQGSRHGAPHHAGHNQRHGNRQGQASGQRGPASGHGPAQRRGPKRPR